MATALQQSLTAVGIKAQLQGYPSSSYFSDFIGVPSYVHSHDLGISFVGAGSDWPDGYGWFTASLTVRPLSRRATQTWRSWNDPAVNGYLAKMSSTNDATVRNSYTSKIDKQVMKDAAILPVVYVKVLLYRNPDLTNAFIDPVYGEYNYAMLGVK